MGGRGSGSSARIQPRFELHVMLRRIAGEVLGAGGEFAGNSMGIDYDPGVTRRFGPFVLDVGRRQLLRNERAQHLTPKAFELLVLLVTEAPRVVSKRELHERLWAGTFISDATLAGLIKELRRALDDHMPDAKIIRTAHRVGYAFGAPLDAVKPRPTRPWHWLVLRGRRVALSEGENVVGRDPTSEVCLDDPSVSRRHARMVIDADGGTAGGSREQERHDGAWPGEPRRDGRGRRRSPGLWVGGCGVPHLRIRDVDRNAEPERSSWERHRRTITAGRSVTHS